MFVGRSLAAVVHLGVGVERDVGWVARSNLSRKE
jgi:hypothetical protein